MEAFFQGKSKRVHKESSGQENWREQKVIVALIGLLFFQLQAPTLDEQCLLRVMLVKLAPAFSNRCFFFFSKLKDNQLTLEQMLTLKTLTVQPPGASPPAFASSAPGAAQSPFPP